MSQWPTTSAKKVYRALLRIGWRDKPRISRSGSHKQLSIQISPMNTLGHFMMEMKSARRCLQRSPSVPA